MSARHASSSLQKLQTSGLPALQPGLASTKPKDQSNFFALFAAELPEASACWVAHILPVPGDKCYDDLRAALLDAHQLTAKLKALNFQRTIPYNIKVSYVSFLTPHIPFFMPPVPFLKPSVPPFFFSAGMDVLIVLIHFPFSSVHLFVM